MYYLTKEFKFEAAHQLQDHDGKCARLHGHSWIAKVTVCGRDVQHTGPKREMLMDYGDLKALVQPIVDEYLDHWFLNDTLQSTAPTSEYIARWLYHRVESRIHDSNLVVHAVRIEETCTSSCVYQPDQ